MDSKTNSIILTILRVISGALFLAAGYIHFANYEVMAVYVPLPVGSRYFVLMVATLISLLAIAVILGRETRKAYFALAIVFAFTGLMILIPTIHFSNDYLLKLVQVPNLYKVVIAVIMFIALIASRPQKPE